MRLEICFVGVSLLSAPALADPIPVHVAVARGSGRGVSALNAERVAVANAVAEVLSPATTELLSATETRTRLVALNPSAQHCDALDCITSITLPLHARALVLVRLTRQRSGTARVEVRLFTLRGEVIAERTEEDVAPSAAEATALARLAAGSLVEATRSLGEPAPPAAASAQPVPPATAAVAPSSVAPSTPRPPPPVRVQTRRRMGEVIAGAAAAALGVTALSVGVAGLARSERVTQTFDDGRELVEQPSAANWAWVGVGAVAAGVGAWLIIDGLRERPVRTSAAIVPLPGGALLSASGRF